MKIDVVYKLGNRTKDNDLELRYSLRSLSNFKDLGKVYIVGCKPDWVQNVNFISCQDCFCTNKDANLINKLILATQEPGISQEFLNFSDDQVLLKECTYEDFIIPFYDNSLINWKQDQKLSRWKTRLKNTVRALSERGLPTNCYETHIPTLINIYNYTKTVFQYNYPEGQGMCGNTLYFNTIKKEGKIVPDNYLAKIEGALLDIKVLESLCDGRLHLSYAEMATNDILYLYLSNRFPDKSKFEKDE
jgi:hypothetical protein